MDFVTVPLHFVTVPLHFEASTSILRYVLKLRLSSPYCSCSSLQGFLWLPGVPPRAGRSHQLCHAHIPTNTIPSTATATASSWIHGIVGQPWASCMTEDRLTCGRGWGVESKVAEYGWAHNSCLMYKVLHCWSTGLVWVHMQTVVQVE